MNFAPFAFNSTQIPIIQDGLIIYADVNNNQSYNGTGTNWHDLSGNNYDGTLFNGVVFQTGTVNSFFLDGTNDYIQFPSSSVGSDTGDFSMSCWVSGITDTKASVILLRGQSSADWSLRLENDNTQANTVTAGAAVKDTITGSTVGVFARDNGLTFSANTWYYFTEVWNSGVDVKLYVNGTLQNTTTTTRQFLRSNTTGWNFGRYGTAYYSFCCAEIDVYNRNLNDNEVLNNFNNLKTRYGY